MNHKIMITSLRKRDVKDGLQFFCFSEGDKNIYCDALTSAEAGSKYILANYNIDTIFAFGSDSTFDQGDDLRSMMLNEGNSLYSQDVKDMSSFSLYRYRLAEYLDEINAEIQDARELLDEKQRESAEEFINRFFDEKVNMNGVHKFSRFFDKLFREDDLRKELEAGLRKLANEVGADPGKYLNWAWNYIYMELRDISRMHILECNEDVKVRFLSTEDDLDNEKTFTDLLISSLEHIININESDSDVVDVYLCTQNDNTRDAFVLTSLAETIRAMPDSRINVARIILTDAPSVKMVETITDDTGKLGVYELLSATRAFLRYGKTDLLMDFNDASGIHNHEIDRMLFAMKNIDTGISLCDISDIERGITRLREIFSEEFIVTGDSFAEKYFNIIVRGIKRDYGSLLSGDKINFIELVKWAYRKGFWQQTLTLIESRAPREFVDKGIYYYCDSEENRDFVIEKLGKIYYDLKPFEKYKLDDVDHYYVKFYNRWRAPHPKDSREYQFEYSRIRMEELDTDDEELIRAHTLCPDREALRDLLFSYYYLGDVRNMTNHATDEFSGFTSIRDDSDASERMNLISQAVEYFLHSYNKVMELISDSSKDAQIIRVETADLADYAKSLRRPAREERK